MPARTGGSRTGMIIGIALAAVMAVALGAGAAIYFLLTPERHEPPTCEATAITLRRALHDPRTAYELDAAITIACRTEHWPDSYLRCVDEARDAAGVRDCTLPYDLQSSLQQRLDAIDVPAVTAPAPAPKVALPELPADTIYAVDITADVRNGQMVGPMDAPVTIVVAFDLACPYCNALEETLQQVVSRYGRQVRIVYKNMIIHANVTAAHHAACAAGRQGKFLAFHKLWLSDAFPERAFGRDSIDAVATKAGVDLTRMATDMNDADCNSIVDLDQSQLERLGTTGTPTEFINGIKLSGAMPFDSLRAVIDERLAIAKADIARGVRAKDIYDVEVMRKGITTRR